MKFASFHNWHRADDCIVTVPGPSFMESQPTHRPALCDYWTIACNRALTAHRANYAVCLETSADPIWLELDLRGVSALFTHRPVGDMRGAKKRPPPDRSVNINCKDVRRFLDPEAARDEPAKVLRLNQSAFYGIAIAAHMGFRNIGVIGLDLTLARFPTTDGIERAYTRLRGVIERRRQRVWNLSPDSALESLQFGTIEFIKRRDEIGALLV